VNEHAGDSVDAFARLLGRQPSDAERERLHRLRAELGLRGNDALWLVLVALQYHLTLYQSIPARIERAATAACRQVTRAAGSSDQPRKWQGWPELVTALLIGVALGAAVTAAALHLSRR
jgi:hypothetical protein